MVRVLLPAVVLARYEPGMIAGLTKYIAARLPRRGRVARRRRDRGYRRRLGAGRREARDRDDGDDNQRVAACRCRLRDERRLRIERVSWASSLDDLGLGSRACSASGIGLVTAMLDSSRVRRISALRIDGALFGYCAR